MKLVPVISYMNATHASKTVAVAVVQGVSKKLFDI